MLLAAVLQSPAEIAHTGNQLREYTSLLRGSNSGGLPLICTQDNMLCFAIFQLRGGACNMRQHRWSNDAAAVACVLLLAIAP